jgi:hypothetical protein
MKKCTLIVALFVMSVMASSASADDWKFWKRCRKKQAPVVAAIPTARLKTLNKKIEKVYREVAECLDETKYALGEVMDRLDDCCGYVVDEMMQRLMPNTQNC